MRSLLTEFAQLPGIHRCWLRVRLPSGETLELEARSEKTSHSAQDTATSIARSVSTRVSLRDEPVGEIGVETGPYCELKPLKLLESIAELLEPALILLHDSLSAIPTRDVASVEPALPVRTKSIIGNDKTMQAVYEQIGQVAGSDTTVLVLGESGVGKELVANAIHHSGSRANKPFIKVNCAALPETLLESELFGHERGAFTGAIYQKKGRFELASGGTLFLDEIGDFSPTTQVKLLRVLQERCFERLGGTTSLKADVRIIAATNRDLNQLIAEGKFRQDLYYRINVFPIHIPPLRERKTDILLLADHFVEKYNRLLTRNVRRISTPAIDMLMSYHWPGNVRELENCIERAVLLSKDDVIHGQHLPPSLQTAETSGTQPEGTFKGAVTALEHELVVEALKNARGNMAKAARDLGISERMMGVRVRRYGIKPELFRTPPLSQ